MILSSMLTFLVSGNCCCKLYPDFNRLSKAVYNISHAVGEDLYETGSFACSLSFFSDNSFPRIGALSGDSHMAHLCTLAGAVRPAGSFWRSDELKIQLRQAVSHHADIA